MSKTILLGIAEDMLAKSRYLCYLHEEVGAEEQVEIEKYLASRDNTVITFKPDDDVAGKQLVVTACPENEKYGIIQIRLPQGVKQQVNIIVRERNELGVRVIPVVEPVMEIFVNEVQRPDGQEPTGDS